MPFLPNQKSPSITRPAEDADAAYINAEHEAGQGAERKSLQHYLNAGRRLLKKKRELQGEKEDRRGGWYKWIEGNLTFTRPTVDRYIAFAKEVQPQTVCGYEQLQELWASTRYNSSQEPSPQDD